MSFRSRASACVFLGATLLAVPLAADFSVDLGRGPVNVNVPGAYNSAVPAPLILLLHGYGSDGATVSLMLSLGLLSEVHGFLYAAPEGTVDTGGSQFWNATDYCCGFGSSVDDSGYLKDLIDAIKVQANIDEKRVYIFGHSNGGFMAHRMACDHSDTIAAIVSLAGANYKDFADCGATSPVHVLQMHGRQDTSVLFSGSCQNPFVCYPGAVETVTDWAAANGCSLPVRRRSSLDLDLLVSGDDTRRFGIPPFQCDPGGSVQLWVMPQSDHVPIPTLDFNDAIVDYFLENPKP